MNTFIGQLLQTKSFSAPSAFCTFGLCGECGVDQRRSLRGGQSSPHARCGTESQQHRPWLDSSGLGQQYRR